MQLLILLFHSSFFVYISQVIVESSFACGRSLKQTALIMDKPCFIRLPYKHWVSNGCLLRGTFNCILHFNFVINRRAYMVESALTSGPVFFLFFSPAPKKSELRIPQTAFKTPPQKPSLIVTFLTRSLRK